VSEEPGSITTIVNDIARGSARDGGAMVDRLHRELEALARSRLRTFGQDAEIRTGDLVNEAYLKLFAGSKDGGHEGARWENRRHFFGAAARAMQQVVIDLLRRIDVRKAHATRIAVPIESADAPTQTISLPELVQLLDALDRADPVAAEVMRMTIFAGLSVSEAANVLGLSLRTAQRKWTLGRGVARAWLAERMNPR
jgi:RNA polymerase sigma factor (TIGR02999 family)